MLIVEPSELLCTFNNNPTAEQNQNNSFISKYSLELFDAIKDIKDDS